MPTQKSKKPATLKATEPKVATKEQVAREAKKAKREYADLLKKLAAYEPK